MPRNVEVKAHLTDPTATESLVIPHATGGPLILQQEDTFFSASRGRLKLRRSGVDQAELIWYERPDRMEACESRYIRCGVPDPYALAAILDAVLGIRGTVRKRRTVYVVGQTRVHLDEVAGLGNFLELEVVLEEGQSLGEGKTIADSLLKQLAVSQDDLVAVAYVDLLAQPQ
jgi:predicted adenylyl cyclase CyaB